MSRFLILLLTINIISLCKFTNVTYHIRSRRLSLKEIPDESFMQDFNEISHDGKTWDPEKQAKISADLSQEVSGVVDQCFEVKLRVEGLIADGHEHKWALVAGWGAVGRIHERVLVKLVYLGDVGRLLAWYRAGFQHFYFSVLVQMIHEQLHSFIGHWQISTRA